MQRKLAVGLTSDCKSCARTSRAHCCVLTISEFQALLLQVAASEHCALVCYRGKACCAATMPGPVGIGNDGFAPSVCCPLRLSQPVPISLVCSYLLVPTSRQAGVETSWHLRVYTAGVASSDWKELPPYTGPYMWFPAIIGWLHVRLKRAWGLPGTFGTGAGALLEQPRTRGG